MFYLMHPTKINSPLMQCCYSIYIFFYIYSLFFDSPLSAVVQTVDLTVWLLQLELVGHRRGDLHKVNLVSNLNCSCYSGTDAFLKVSLPGDKVFRSAQSMLFVVKAQQVSLFTPSSSAYTFRPRKQFMAVTPEMMTSR